MSLRFLWQMYAPLVDLAHDHHGNTDANGGGQGRTPEGKFHGQPYAKVSTHDASDERIKTKTCLQQLKSVEKLEILKFVLLDGSF